jgi:hypothetical protein
MKRSLSISVLTATLMLAACKSDEAPAAEPAAEPPPAAPAAAPEPAAEPEPDPTAEQVPVPDDFEDEALEEVTPDTLRAELDALEKEIAPTGIPN